MREQPNEPKNPPAETDLYLSSLQSGMNDILSLHDNRVQFTGLPFEEWAGPGYASAALFDPHVLAAPLPGCRLILDGLAADLGFPGLSLLETRSSQKEKITFRLGPSRTALYYLPIWRGMSYYRLDASSEWRAIASIGELPGVLLRQGTAVFAFNPLRVIHRYLNMAEPASTRDFTDLIVRAILAASGCDQELDDHDLRRDFHALGISVLLMCQMHRAVGRIFSVEELRPTLQQAARQYLCGDYDEARRLLGGLFKAIKQKREQLVGVPVYIMVMPHGGILFEREGYAEYDWPEAAARVLNLMLDWTDRHGFRFAPDIGASTLEQLAKTHPATLQRFKAAWDQGLVEFVNGTYSQPYLQVFPMWDQDKQFELGLNTFEKLFGKRPTVFASQEMALHAGLPTLLKKHRYQYAIHRAQNLGTALRDSAALIEWCAPGEQGTSIRTLPAHPLRSEKRGGEIWRHLPILLTSERNQGLPFIALSDLMDQTFIDIYNEEIVRANQYAPVWGEFLTPTEFFHRTATLTAEQRSYDLDDYHYHLDLSGYPGNTRYSGGYSSELAFMLRESLRLREMEAAGQRDPQALRLLMEQEAHDCYIIPQFAQGQFMGSGLTDYSGPRIQAGPQGARLIRQAAGYPQEFQDDPPATAEPCDISGTLLTCSLGSALIDARSGAVVRLGDLPVSLGMPRFNGVPMQVTDIRVGAKRLCISGRWADYGPITIEYFLSSGQLFGVLSGSRSAASWEASRTCWADCVYLEHANLPASQVIRVVSGIAQPTELAQFHSLSTLTLRSDARNIVLQHGGNIFFRQDQASLHNRLWCYGEFCTRFWWSVGLETRTPAAIADVT